MNILKVNSVVPNTLGGSHKAFTRNEKEDKTSIQCSIKAYNQVSVEQIVSFTGNPTIDPKRYASIEEQKALAYKIILNDHQARDFKLVKKEAGNLSKAINSYGSILKKFNPIVTSSINELREIDPKYLDLPIIGLYMQTRKNVYEYKDRVRNAVIAIRNDIQGVDTIFWNEGVERIYGQFSVISDTFKSNCRNTKHLKDFINGEKDINEAYNVMKDIRSAVNDHLIKGTKDAFQANKNRQIIKICTKMLSLGLIGFGDCIGGSLTDLISPKILSKIIDHPLLSEGIEHMAHYGLDAIRHVAKYI